MLAPMGVRGGWRSEKLARLRRCSLLSARKGRVTGDLRFALSKCAWGLRDRAARLLFVGREIWNNIHGRLSRHSAADRLSTRR